MRSARLSCVTFRIPSFRIPVVVQGSLAIARALQRVSSYPVLLLTNSTTLPDGTGAGAQYGRGGEEQGARGRKVSSRDMGWNRGIVMGGYSGA